MGLFKVNTNIPNKPIKNPNWQEADQLAIYNRNKGVELGPTENKYSRYIF